TGGSAGSGTGGSAGSGTGGSAGSGTGGSAGSGTGGSAGSGGGSGGLTLDCAAHTTATPESACDDYADAVCSLMERCAPGMLSFFGATDHAICVAVYRNQCSQELAAPGSRVTPAFVAAYSVVTESVSCDDFGNDALGSADASQPECGSKSGSLAGGATCYTSSQCTSRKCGEGSDPCHGTCAALGKLGDGCGSDDNCPSGAYCDTVDHTCKAQGDAGASCSSESCKSGLFCGAGDKCQVQRDIGESCTATEECKGNRICGKEQKCKKPALAALGETCDPDEESSCDPRQLLTCDDATSKCVGMLGPLPGLGDPCVFACGGGASCLNKVCVAIAKNGESCDETAGPACMLGSTCKSGSCTPLSAACQ
ncbi:MAG: hypothetical protein OZ928_15245, partial [Polyangiaceae bacterium]|nr:hypothetical protein [Polyangiaceae bacterium]